MVVTFFNTVADSETLLLKFETFTEVKEKRGVLLDFRQF